MVFERVAAFVAELLGISKDAVRMESDFINELNADSLDIAQMLITLEQEFDIEFDDEQIVMLKTVGDVVRFIELENSK